MRFPSASLAAVRSISFHFQRDTTAGQGWKIIVAPHRHRSETRKPTLFFLCGKLSLPTGREATNRAQRPRWRLISVLGNEPCHQELISPVFSHLFVVLSRRDIESRGATLPTLISQGATRRPCYYTTIESTIKEIIVKVISKIIRLHLAAWCTRPRAKLTTIGW